MFIDLENKLRATGLVPMGWSEDVKRRGKAVKLARDYYDGEHNVYLTDDMKAMLRSNMGFQDNYCGLVVNTMMDRLVVRGVAASNAAAQPWLDDLTRRSRFDALQLDVTQAVLRDGDSFVMVEYADGVQLYHELAFDGTTGVIPIYDRRGQRLVGAVKIWWDVDGRRVNVYYPDRVEKYRVREQEEDVSAGKDDRGDGGGVLEVIPPAPGDTYVNATQAIPLVHFKNRAGSRDTLGKSEIEGAIPLQDVLNRTLASMVSNTERSAFQVWLAKGFKPPARLQPGSIIYVTAEDTDTPMNEVDMRALETGAVGEYVTQAQFIIDQIGTVTLTPLPSMLGGDSQSGEALKQRQTGLIGKVERTMVRLGNGWEDVFEVAALTHNTYAPSQVADTDYQINWKDSQVRNAAEVVANVMAVRELIGDEQAVRELGSVFGWDEAKVQLILAGRQAEESRRIAALGGSLPGFENFNAAAA